ncbi:MAG: hypothetical protein WCC94_04975 [Candidatus Bathyarchaeia archaeon]
MVNFEIETYSNVTEAQVQNELSTIIEDFFENEKPNLDVIVPLSFETAVRKLVPYETGVEYKANHGYGIAEGKTIPLLRKDQLRFVIVLDAKVFKDMSPAAFLGRWARIVHELIHVRVDLQRFRAIGALQFFAIPHSKMEIARHNTVVFCEEYLVERTVANLMIAATMKVRKSSGNEIVRFAEIMGFADDILRDLHSYEGFLEESVQRFQEPGTDPTSLTSSLTGTIAGIILRLAKVYAVGEVSGGVRSRISEIEDNGAFRKYFAQSWARILSQMREYYANHTSYRSDIIDAIANEYDDLLKKSGIRIEDAPAGFHVSMTIV